MKKDDITELQVILFSTLNKCIMEKRKINKNNNNFIRRCFFSFYMVNYCYEEC